MNLQQDIYCINTEDDSDEQLSTGDDLSGEAVVQKNSWTPSRDDRKSCRRTVPEARQSCELKVGADVFPALLVDESRGGFAVLIDRLDDLESGKKVKLHTDMGWFTVRIVYVKKVVRPAHSNSTCDTWFRLGLRKARSFLLF